jgi:hypothetical protein
MAKTVREPSLLTHPEKVALLERLWHGLSVLHVSSEPNGLMMSCSSVTVNGKHGNCYSKMDLWLKRGIDGNSSEDLDSAIGKAGYSFRATP